MLCGMKIPSTSIVQLTVVCVPILAGFMNSQISLRNGEFSTVFPPDYYISGHSFARRAFACDCSSSRGTF